jgi:anaerobic magnesium-protoporphyrin IX monomethyl ester cyclase
MRVLLVYSLRDARSARCPLGSLQDIHLGLSSVAGSLQARGHEVRLVVLHSELGARSQALLEERVAALQPALVGFTAVATQYPFVAQAAAQLKTQRPHLYLVIGGVHATLRPEEVMAGPFDALCLGEGEEPAAELAAQLEGGSLPGGIRNLWLRRPGGLVEKNSVREFREDLDNLPAPHREMWHEWVGRGGGSRQVVLPSRRCPYQSTYCCNHALFKVARGKYVRFRSPAGVVREIQQLRERYPETREVYLQSETIAVHGPWLRALSDGLSQLNGTLEEPLEYVCNFRVARPFLREEVFQALARAGVRTLEVGLESGSERVRREVLRRHYSNAEFLQAVRLARQHGMRVNVYNMIGLPGETEAEHQQTVELNREANPDRSLTSIFFPYPGTDLHETCRQRGLLGKTVLPTSERTRATLDLPHFRKRDIQRAFEWFEFHLYQGHRPLHYRLRKVLRNKIAASTALNRLFLRLLPWWERLGSLRGP